MKKDVKNRLGEIAGIAIDQNNDILYIFHRAKRNWDLNTDLSKISEPIKENTIIMINATDSSFIYSWGSNQFYMPHGISLDKFGNVWLTDVSFISILN